VQTFPWRLLFGLSVVTVLAACSPATKTTVRYDLQLGDVPTEELATILTSADHILRSRLAHLEVEDPSVQVTFTGTGQALAVLGVPRDVVETLTAELTEPYTLRLMRSVGTGGTVTVAKHGDFVETGLTEAHIDWAGASEIEGGLGQVTLFLTEEGRTLHRQLSADYADQKMALFVRGLLVSVFTMQAGVDGDIVLSKIPSPGVARVFVDDLLVGRFVTFRPTPEPSPPSS
jgi:hypothetical protein